MSKVTQEATKVSGWTGVSVSGRLIIAILKSRSHESDKNHENHPRCSGNR